MIHFDCAGGGGRVGEGGGDGDMRGERMGRANLPVASRTFASISDMFMTTARLPKRQHPGQRREGLHAWRRIKGARLLRVGVRLAGADYPFLNRSLPIENALCACRGETAFRTRGDLKIGGLWLFPVPFSPSPFFLSLFPLPVPQDPPPPAGREETAAGFLAQCNASSSRQQGAGNGFLDCQDEGGRGSTDHSTDVIKVVHFIARLEILSPAGKLSTSSMWSGEILEE